MVLAGGDERHRSTHRGPNTRAGSTSQVRLVERIASRFVPLRKAKKEEEPWGKDIMSFPEERPKAGSSGETKRPNKSTPNVHWHG